MTDKNFNEKKEAFKLAHFLVSQCRIDSAEFENLKEELFEALNTYNLCGIEVFFDNMLYRRKMKAYEYVALQKMNEFLEKVRKIRDYDVFREVEKAIRTMNK